MSIVNILGERKRQSYRGVSTWGGCHNGCGKSARGSSECIDCLTSRLAEEVGNDMALEYKEALSRLCDLEYTLCEAVDGKA